MGSSQFVGVDFASGLWFADDSSVYMVAGVLVVRMEVIIHELFGGQCMFALLVELAKCCCDG